MKKILLITALALVIVWGVGVQRAVAGYMNNISFYAVDDVSDPVGGDGSVTLTNLSISFSSSPGTLEYSVDQSSWYAAGNSFTVNPVQGGMEQVYFRLNYTTYMVTSGNITFLAPEGNNLFNSLKVDWSNQADMTITIADNDDNVAPVPIPAAIWLLGSGLFGLIGIRRRSGRA